MVEVQMLCFHIISEFLYKSKMSKREEKFILLQQNRKYYELIEIYYKN